MSNQESALIPSEERAVDFYGDELRAYLIEGEPYIPIRPICDYLGISWSAQYERIKRDTVLSEAQRLIRVTRTNSAGGRPEITCLPLKYLNGWLFGINAARVKPELRDRIIQYQRECYEVLAQAFQAPGREASSLAHIRDMALAIAQMAEQQMILESRVTTTEARLDRAALVVGDISKRLGRVEDTLRPSAYISDEQASEISLQVKALAKMLQDQGAEGNTYQSVFSELYRRYGVSSYKLIRQSQYPSVIGFLSEWGESARTERS